MEKIQQQQWGRVIKSWLSYRNATIIVCLFNVITALFLLQGFLNIPSSSHKALYRHIKESEDIRHSMVPLDLIKRVREIEKEAYVGTEPVPKRDSKQTAAADLISRLNNFHSYSDAGNVKGDVWFLAFF
ncbi:uncharacterized protein LOC111391656 [Olea europaea subsp. europaea]|uniref:Uncharacterized protein LOC111391656 n=1 Tax=Olea europaea subsp. europaea TaxID=158383 RepID=A0A8S0TYR9_OLEEU|nr:uncharacterized protein LOC111391656 [Olea europaea subsp. europaea]